MIWRISDDAAMDLTGQRPNAIPAFHFLVGAFLILVAAKIFLVGAKIFLVGAKIFFVGTLIFFVETLIFFVEALIFFDGACFPLKFHIMPKNDLFGMWVLVAGLASCGNVPGYPPRPA